MSDDTQDDPNRGMAHLTARVYEICRLIPAGRVTTYGHIAKLSGYPRHSRHVGSSLKVLPNDSTVPWHRVISSKGTISPRFDGGIGEQRQRERLEEEGVEVTTMIGGGVNMGVGAAAGGGTERVDLKVYGWFPDELDERQGVIN